MTARAGADALYRHRVSVSAGLLALLLSGIGQAADAPLLRFGTEGAYAPFNFIGADGKPQGFDVEIGEALCAALQRRCQWVVQDWDGLIPGLNAKRFDAILASMAITEKRKAAVDFTDPYYASPGIVLARAGQGGPLTQAFLTGKTLGVQQETIYEAYLDAEMPGWATVRRYRSQDEAAQDLLNGRLDMLMANSTQLDSWVKANGGYGAFARVGAPFRHPSFGAGAGIAVRKGDAVLHADLNRALAQIVQDGRFAKITARYFDFDIR